MKIIRTLAGDLPAEQFGIIDYHEHVIARPPVEKPNDIDLSLNDVDTMAKELATYTDRQKENDRIAGDALLRLAEEEIRKVERAREEQMLFLFSLAGEREESAWDIRTALKS